MAVLKKSASLPKAKKRLITGTPDPYHPGMQLIRFDRSPDDPRFKPLNPRYTFQETYYRWDGKTNRVRCLVTIMADGTSVAWDTCSYCHHYFSGCTCQAGIQTARSVEYIHDAILARYRGEEWTHTHKDYRGSLTRADRDARKLAADRVISPTRVVLVPPAGSVPSEGRTRLRKVGGLRRLPEVDVSSINESASAVVDGLTEQLTSALNGKPRKLIKKVAQKTGKKVIRRSGA